MDEIEQLFVRTLDDLENKISSDDPYETLGASALIRKLFLDGSNSLVDQVNRTQRVKLEFHIAIPVPSFPPGIDPDEFKIQLLIVDGLDPETSAPDNERRTVTRDQFFATCIVTNDADQYSVRQVVLFEAHVMGGVHAGSPKDEIEKALQDIASRFRIQNARGSLRQLRGICRVVLRALAPLRSALE